MSLTRLPVLTQITEYNTYSFEAASTVETVGYAVRCLYDAANRTVWACEFTITVQWYIEVSSLTDPTVEVMVAKLTKPGGVLKYTGRGFGPNREQVNAGVVRDVDWGPKPSNVELEPVGGGKVVKARWTVAFRVPTCSDAAFNGIREFSYTLGVEVDRAGYSTRTYTATLKIAQTRAAVDSRVPLDTADRYYEQVVPAKLTGFHRVSQSRQLSADKSELTVTVVDTEQPPGVLPGGLVEGSVEHTFQAVAGSYLLKWTSTITARYEVAKADGTVDAAVEDFFAIVKDRKTRAEGMRTAKGPKSLPEGPPLGPLGVIPTAFSVSEVDVYGRTRASMSISYSLAGVPLDEIFRAGGLWQPVALRDWRVWAASVKNTFGPRGAARLVFAANDDKIVDLCGPGVEPETPAAPAVGTITGAAAFIVGGAANPLRPARDWRRMLGLREIFPPPAGKSSWIDYKCFVRVVADTGRVVGTTLPGDPGAGRSIWDPNIGAGRSIWDPGRGEMQAGVPAAPPFPGLADTARAQGAGGPFVQQRVAPTYYVQMFGSAQRVNNEIPCPELLQVDGVRPTLVGRPEFTTGVVGSALYPVYAAEWSLWYVFADGPPNRVPAPPNLGLA